MQVLPQKLLSKLLSKLLQSFCKAAGAGCKRLALTTSIDFLNSPFSFYPLTRLIRVAKMSMIHDEAKSTGSSRMFSPATRSC